MKYLEIDILWINDAILHNEIVILKIDFPSQLADIGTKLNPAAIFLSLRSFIMS